MSTTSAPADWLAPLEACVEEEGYLEPLGSAHWAFFIDASPTLVVTFETADSIRAREGGLSHGHAVAAAHGWSHLCVISEGDTWYRDPAVYRYFDRLVDDAFFEDFDRVLFYGAGMGGYAAAAYSVAAPGATVLAVSPVATLDPGLAGWDKRFRQHRRLDFNSRFGFAPDMVEGAGDVFILYDPEQRLDAMHASMFNRPFVRHLRCRRLGTVVRGGLEKALRDMKLLDGLMADATTGNLTAAGFYASLRARRSFPPYILGLQARLDALRRPFLQALLCRNVFARTGVPRFRRRLAELVPELAAQGKSLPEAR